MKRYRMMHFMKKIKTTLATVAVVGAILAANPLVALASPASLFISHTGFNLNENSGWNHSVAVSNGQFVQLYVEVQTQPGMDAVQNLTVKIDLPSSGGNSTATVSTSSGGVASRSDSVSFDFRGATNCKLIYESGSTGVRLDRNRDGSPESDGPWSSDSISSGGINLGDFGTGPNGGLVQINTKNRVECQTPSTSTSTPSSSTQIRIIKFNDRNGDGRRDSGEEGLNWNFSVDGPGADDSKRTTGSDGTVTFGISSGQTTITEEFRGGWVSTTGVSQTVNVNNGETKEVIFGNRQQQVVAKVQPATGVGLMPLIGMFGAGPLGLVLSRYGRGQVFARKKEESLSDLAKGLVTRRQAVKA